ncbi:MAG: PIN domain-containing protein [Luteitalea sp.]|nr:PIN domain-containing protein [Luteitalea sp.]
MALVDGIFFDTSLLIAGLIELEHPNVPAQRVIDALTEGRLGRCQTAWHCCLEFYSVSTRLPVEFRLDPVEALRLIEEEILPRVDVVGLPDAFRLPFLRAAAQDGVIGGRVYDLHIAETARVAGAELVLTENRRHFSSLLRHGIRVQTAAEFLEELEAPDAAAGRAATDDTEQP